MSLPNTYLWINLSFGCCEAHFSLIHQIMSSGVFQQNGECQATGIEIAQFLLGQEIAPSLYQRPCCQG